MSNPPRSHLRAGFGPALLLALSSLAATGCKDDTGPGAVVIEFVLGNSKTCEEVGVENMRVSLERSGMSLYSETAPCSEGEVYIEGIDPKNYDLIVEGLDANGVATFDNGAAPSKIEVFDNSEARESVNLTAKPAELRVRWSFGFSNCANVGIDRFGITPYQQGGGTQLFDEIFIDCDAPGDSAGYRVVEDPNRLLNGEFFGEVGVRPVDSSGTTVGMPVPFVFDPPGAGYPVQLTLECTDGGCTGMVEP